MHFDQNSESINIDCKRHIVLCLEALATMKTMGIKAAGSLLCLLPLITYSFTTTTTVSKTSCRALSEIPSDFSVSNEHEEPPPAFSVVGSSNDDTTDEPAFPDATFEKEAPPPAVKNNDDNDDDFDVWVPPPPRQKKKRPNTMAGTSWMDKNQKFLDPVDNRRTKKNKQERQITAPPGDEEGGRNNNMKTFRQDFRGTRVFVQNIPDHVNWQDLKDHFRVAGEVVFASVSVDRDTGAPKGHGVVQFEDTDGAQKAIKIMRDHPLEGSQLYVRPDAQEREGGAALKSVSPGGGRGPTPPTKWRCADEDALESMEQEEYKAIRSLIKARDDARRRKNYSASDEMRNDLKFQHAVHLDDRLKMWWVSVDGKNIPSMVSETKGDGRWGNLQPWRQIPTTPENDACIDSDLVMGLLKQRDVSRREKDFSTADKLLEEARDSPDGDLSLRIHDESRTWRIWTDAPPPKELIARPNDEWVEPQRRRPAAPRSSPSSSAGGGLDQTDLRNAICDECVAIVREHAPHKVTEIRNMLKQFPGREANILQKMKQRYM